MWQLIAHVSVCPRRHNCVLICKAVCGANTGFLLTQHVLAPRTVWEIPFEACFDVAFTLWVAKLIPGANLQFYTGNQILCGFKLQNFGIHSQNLHASWRHHEIKSTFLWKGRCEQSASLWPLLAVMAGYEQQFFILLLRVKNTLMYSRCNSR